MLSPCGILFSKDFLVDTLYKARLELFPYELGSARSEY